MAAVLVLTSTSATGLSHIDLCQPGNLANSFVGRERCSPPRHLCASDGNSSLYFKLTIKWHFPIVL